MPTYQLKIKLLSETTFGRGDGQAGVVDLEVQHDELGRPYWSGRAIKGVLVNECADILDMLAAHPDTKPDYEDWRDAAGWLFGRPGGAVNASGCLSFGEAHLPDDLCRFFARQFEERVKNELKQDDSPAEKRRTAAKERERYRKLLLRSITTDRSQTALEEDGSAKEHSLRTQRVLMPGLVLFSDLNFHRLPENDRQKGLLAACVKSLRSGGSRRNRGRGDLHVSLLEDGEDVTQIWFDEYFKKGVQS